MFLNNIVSLWDFNLNCEKRKNDIIYSKDIVYFNNEGCLICLEEFVEGEECLLFECNHLYHTNCIYQYINTCNKNKSCVICNI